MVILGIDEAGRGPVVGPLVVCGVVCAEEEASRLKEAGVRDSKTLTREQREKLVPIIKSIIQEFRIIKIPPNEIDRENLNEVEIKAMSTLIQWARVRKVILDVPANTKGIKKYCNKIKQLIHDSEVEIIGEPHADSTYPIVSAASILAKVARDWEIDELHKKYGDFGSGYPADPKTRKFVQEWYKTPGIVRRKWLTCAEILVTTGKIIVIGARDTGKTEFCKKLVNLGLNRGYKVGVMDLDIGQSHIGAPGSLGFGIAYKKIRDLSHIPPTIVYPVGTLSPAGHSEKILTGIKYMLHKIPASINFLVIDTTGYVNGMDALKLKIQKVKLINPDRIVFLERNTELDQLAVALGPREIYRFSISSKVSKKSKSKRKKFVDRKLKFNYI
ncbi:MAG: ribonuclease HII [bacterium]|nr:ribonuclease HII [bacterium]